MIIGVTGHKYNGKDTVADYYVKHYGYVKLSFANPLKKVAKILFNFNDRQLYGDLKEEVDARWDITPRQAMQFIGTEMVRDNIGKLLPHIGNDFWAYSTIQHIKEELLINPHSKFIISDVRFPNEVEMLRSVVIDSKKIPSRIIRVKRPSVPMNESSLHESEIHINNLLVDEEIINDGDLEMLYAKIK